MFHTVKKSLSIHKPKEKTTDEEFNSTYEVFKRAHIQAGKISTALKGNAAAWEGLKKNVQGGVDSVFSAFDDPKDFTAEMANQANTAMNTWNNYLAGTADGKKIEEALALLDRYSEFCVQIQKKAMKRQDLVKDLDYYRGKSDNLRKKQEKSSKTKDKEVESLERAESKVDELSGAFEGINYELMDEMGRCIALKSQVFGCALAAFLELQRKCSEALSSSLGSHTKQDASGVLMSPDWWPRDEDFAMGTATLPSSSSSRELGKRTSMSSTKSTPTTGRNSSRPQSISASTYVRALYDYQASQSDELTIAPGDEIKLVEVVDGNWMKGRLRGREGIFPVSYVEYV
eukprot:comp23495_c1_seq1/m.39346 comp23495_c1_seq1/g.39346  ORF comp23495_c1_seq1/g.39346 comp23495_c1_seq1/m.39346 type:complete len:344 (-) comp23495_c1_seq1:39-1070(-)